MTENMQPSSQLLVLKVMRLARPKLGSIAGFSADPVDPSGFSQLLETALNKVNGETRQDLPVGEFLMAPQMFESIYLGETFTFYVNCVNESDQKVTDISIKCDLQTNNQRITLPCNVHDAELEGGQGVGQIISHEVKEIGQHILMCSVNYKTSSDEKMYFRKFFKFPVSKPIDVKTKFYSAEDNSSNDVYLEAQIENTSAVTMVLERIEMEPSQYYTAASVKPFDESEWSSMVVRPRDIRQFLFCLTPKDSQHVLGYKDMTNIGKLDMSWRTAMGERGRLQTSPLQRIAPGYGDVRLLIEHLPATVYVREPFRIGCRIYNCCERVLDLHLVLDDSSRASSLIFCSTSGVSLGQLPPNGSLSFSIELLPVSIGFQSISGIHIIDSFLKRTYEHDDVAQVFVM